LAGKEPSQDDKPSLPAAKLESYAGQGASVESFLAKFKSHATYLRWSKQDRVFQLKNSLPGTTAQALWTGGKHATFEELIKILHSRHGSKQRTERFWSELARSRRKDEPLQYLCQDIKRLMYLAIPHETGPLSEHISIEHYVAALGDPSMRMHVFSRDSVMLEDALNASVRYEALLLGITEQAPYTAESAVLDPASYVYDDKGRKKEIIRAVEKHQEKQRELERSLEAQKALNDENKLRRSDQQRQLDS